MWLAGGGVRSGFVLGKSDELGFGVEEDPVHVHDLQATVLHCLGIDHRKLTYRAQGREFRLTDVGGKVVRKIAGLIFRERPGRPDRQGGRDVTDR